jgi:hypothetical protein
VLDKQQPFRQRITARIVWLGKVAGPGLEGVQEADLRQRERFARRHDCNTHYDTNVLVYT